MPIVTEHAAGSFCWFELATSDQSAAKQFYSHLFGWSVADFPMGPSGVYSMFRLEGQDVAACYTMRKEQSESGVPPNWALYIAVSNADATVAKAKEMGGIALTPAFDVAEHGRMAVLADPTAVSFCVWQAKAHKGARIAGVDGTVCWADLSSPDPAAATKFYEGLFGWQFKPGEQGDYLHILNAEQYQGGVTSAAHRHPGEPPHWLLYFQVSDCAASEARSKQLGAKVLVPTSEIPKAGKFAIAQDPQGATFAFFENVRA